jgi:hypothetical protein
MKNITLSEFIIGFISLIAFLCVCAAMLGIGFGIAARFAKLIMG